MKTALKNTSVFFASGILLLAFNGMLYAQELPVQTLEEVEVTENRLSEYAIGAAYTKIDSVVLCQSQTNSLADLIANYTGSHIKSHGNGMLATVSFRGTGPEHTAVLWHGINIAYPMLGQADFSLLPLALNTEVIIQQGTGVSLYGSGALGGTISLNNQQPVNGLNLSFTQWLGSFGTIGNQSSFSIAEDNYFIQLRTFWQKSANDFKFRNTTQIGAPVETQQNAAFDLFGMGVESGLRFGAHSKLSFSGQIYRADRNLQPNMNAGDVLSYQTDENLRLRLSYEHKGERADWLVQYAHLRDAIGYNGQITQGVQDNVRGEFSSVVIENVKLKLAADYSHISINSPFYSNAHTTESRSNIWASVLLNPKRWVILSVNLRQAFHSTYNAPFSPSLGGEFTIINNSATSLRVNTLLARGFRLPTLNELYWEPGGNLNLIPEDSYSAEIGISGSTTGKSIFEYSARYYRMWVDNWILWRPTASFWSPENIKNVDVYGVEFTGSVSHRIGRNQLKLIGNYAYTRSINRTGLDQFDRSVNKQLSYVPVHKGNLSLISVLSKWSFTLNGNFTGLRYTSADNESTLPAYILLNLRASRQFEIGKVKFSGNAAINNITNTSYQSVVNKAMPGVNFLLGLTINFYKP